MKKILISGLILIAALACTEMEESQPAKVLASFKQKYPKAENVHWEEVKGEKWLATFTEPNSGQNYAQFTEDGKWIQTELDLPEKLVPSDIPAKIDSISQGVKILSTSIRYLPEGDNYVFETKKGDDVLEMIFDLSGTYIRTDTITD